MNRKRRKRQKRQYFTQEHENAIIRYNNSSDLRTRTLLYINFIQPAFDEMVDKIVFTYKFTNLPNIESLREECKIYLTTILAKYNPEKGSKAFSYFSVITKNWFIHKVKKNNTQNKKEVDIEELSVDHQLQYASTRNKYEQRRQEAEFWSHLWEEIESWEQMKLKANEEKVLKAIKILLSDINNPNLIFNKKAIYLYIREITGLNTKQVVNNLNKLRTKYRTFKSKWNEGQI
tara:strand:- start:285 stop:980 length:696 start_codon:yes stop_codon:yes gene_type:complete